MKAKELDAKDLMIGDLVYGCIEEEIVGEAKWKILSRVSEINKLGDITCDCIHALPDELDLQEGDDFSWIEPIPLTAEILEKNGFERCVSSIARSSTAAIPICNSNQFSCKGYGNLRIIDRGIWHFSLRTPVLCDTEKYEIHEIKYVHQLQHALKLCNIQKEIEL